MSPRILLLCLLLGACRVPDSGGPPTLDVSVPEDWFAAGHEQPPPSSEAWWHSFDVPALTLAIEEALRSNRDLSAAARRVEAAAARARLAGADLRPSVGAGGSGQRNKQVFVGLPVPGGNVLESTATAYGVSLDVSWEVDVWGRLAAAEDAAEADLAASEADLRAAQQSLAAQTAKAWTAWQEARLQRELAERTVGSFARTVELVEQRFASGLGSSLEVRLARSNVSSAEALLERNAELEERAVRQLEILLGRYPEGSLESPLGLPELGGTPPAGLPSDMLLRRPDLIAAEARLVASDRRWVSARAAYYPSLFLTGSTGLVSDDLGDFLDGDFGVWSILANLAQPIYQGGRLRANEALAEANLGEAFELYAARVLRAFGEVETALSIEGRLARQRDLYTQASEEAYAASELAQERYEAGLEDLITVLDAQRRALDSDRQTLDARRRQIEARIDLHLALGGSFEMPASETYAPSNEQDQP